MKSTFRNWGILIDLLSVSTFNYFAGILFQPSISQAPKFPKSMTEAKFSVDVDMTNVPSILGHQVKQ